MTPERNISDLDLDRLQEVLDYDPETGHFTWRLRTGPMCKPDRPAGGIKHGGYRRIGIDGRSYTASHLAWFHYYREAPEGVLDHKNGKRDDNRIENLRLATHAQNSMNQGRSIRNTTGFKGVAVFNKRWNRAKYRALIRHKGKRIFLGLFHTPEEAHEAYCKAARELHGEFARTH